MKIGYPDTKNKQAHGWDYTGESPLKFDPNEMIPNDGGVIKTEYQQHDFGDGGSKGGSKGSGGGGIDAGEAVKVASMVAGGA